VFVGFTSVDDPKMMFVAWTTTPWTLPSNLALCVNPEFTYVKLQGTHTSPPAAVADCAQTLRATACWSCWSPRWPS
jgi:isoleucyl-tRNA synthetase